MLNSVIPDGGELVLQAQGFLPALPGFGSSGSADPNGIGGVSYYVPPKMDGPPNPNPTGNWMDLANTIIKAAQNSFQYYLNGSPSVATPPAQTPQTTIIQREAVQVGGKSISYGTLGIVAVVGVGILYLLTR